MLQDAIMKHLIVRMYSHISRNRIAAVIPKLPPCRDFTLLKKCRLKFS